MDEQEKLLQKNIAITTISENKTTIDEYLVCVATYLLYDFEKCKDLKFEVYKEVKECLSGLFKNKNNRNRFKLYSKESLSTALITEWLGGLTLDKKKSLIAKHKLIEKVNDDGSLRLSQKLVNAYSKVGNIAPVQYGDGEYVQKSKKETKRSSINAESSGLNNASEAENSLKEYWNELFSGNRSFKFPYLWENKMSNSEYSQLKELLTKACPKSNQPRFIQKHCKEIALFVSEWFKREYCGIDRDTGGDAFSEIGLDSNKAQKIWETDFFKKYIDEFVYKTGGESGTYRWKFSLYVLGGFPIFYANNENNTWRRLCRKIWEQYKSDDVQQNQMGDEIDFVNNFVIRQSLSNDSGSLAKYLERFVEDKTLPIADEDRELSEFKRFEESLKLGQTAYKIFNTEWFISYSPSKEFPCMDRWMELTLKGDLYFIRSQNSWWSHLSEEYLVKKGLKNSEEVLSFSLCVRFNGDNSDLRELFTFSKDVVTRSYLCYGCSNKKLVKDFPECDIKSIEVVVKTSKNPNAGDCQIIPLEKIEIPDFIQLYKVDKGLYHWSSKKKYDVKTALLFNSSKYDLNPKVDNVASKRFVGEDTVYSWVDIEGEVTISGDKGKKKSFYNRDNGMELLFKACPSIQYAEGENHKVEMVENDEKSTITLFGGKEWLKVLWYTSKDDMKNGVKSTDVTDNATLSYKDKNNNEWKEWSDDVPQGIMTIKVGYGGRSEEEKVYYLPSFSSSEIIHRNITRNGHLEPKKIYFNLKKVENIATPKANVRNNKNAFRWDKTDNLIFKIGTNNRYVTFEVFPPINKQEVIFNGCKLDSDFNKIPYALRSDFIIKDVSAKGVKVMCLGNKEFDVSKSLYMQLDNDVEERPTEAIADVNCDFYFYLWDNRIYAREDNNRFYVRNEELQKEFKFYFCSLTDFSVEQIEVTFNSDGRMSLPDLNGKKGFVFQSLKNCKPCYFAELFKVEGGGKWTFNDDELRNNPYGFFKVAKEHHITFRLFDPLYETLKDDEKLIGLFFKCASDNGKENDIESFSALERFSKEFYFDWRLLSPQKWRDACKGGNEQEKKKLVELFFAYLDVNSERLFEKQLYWDEASDDWRPYKWKMTGGVRRQNNFNNCYERYSAWQKEYDKTKAIINAINKNKQ